MWSGRNLRFRLCDAWYGMGMGIGIDSGILVEGRSSRSASP